MKIVISIPEAKEMIANSGAFPSYVRVENVEITGPQEVVGRTTEEKEKDLNEFTADIAQYRDALRRHKDNAEAFPHPRRNFNMINAIKLFRGATGMGLKSSKDFVENLIGFIE